MGRIDGVLTKADAWIANNQDLVRVIMQVALIVGAFLAVWGHHNNGVVPWAGFYRYCRYDIEIWGCAEGDTWRAANDVPKSLYAGDAVRGAFTKIQAAGSIAAGG